MATITYPGVYVIEKKGAPGPVQSVAASTLGIIGWTDKGPDHKATLISSWGQFVDKFGKFTADSLVPTTLYSFMKNGGTRAYVVRATPTDAVDSTLYITDTDYTETIEVGDDVTVAFTGTMANPPTPSSVSITYYGDGTAYPGATLAAGGIVDGIKVIWTTGTPGAGEGQFTVPAHLPIKPGTVTIDWTDTGDAAKAQTDDGAGGFTGDGAPENSTIDYETGAIYFDATGDIPKAAVAITIDYTDLAQNTITDDGAGALTGDVDGTGTNTINYTTGAYSFKTTSAPPDHATLGDVDAVYDGRLWKLTMQWPGTYGNNYRIRITGNSSYENKGLGTWSRYDVYIDEYDEDKLVWNQREQYKAVNFSDSTSAYYFPTVLNDDNLGSDIVTVSTPAWESDVPNTLVGTAVSETLLAVSAGETNITGTLAEASCVKYSLTISATAAGGAMTVTDDGSGNLIGDVDAAGTNTINYTTGAYNVTFEAATVVSSRVTCVYVKQPAETTNTTRMTSGTDGTTITSTSVTAAALEADKKGIYAFDEVNDNLLMVIPDFAGDETVDGALIDFCALRQDRFAILSTPESMTPTQAIDYKKNTLNKLSTYGAMYWPWIKIIDPVTEKSTARPPVGHVAGIYARTIQSKNVSKAPAGRDDGQLAYLVGLEYDALDSELAEINNAGINCMIKRPQVGTAVWGARTLDINDEYRYVQARMLAMYLRKAIYNSTQWIVFENNGPELWTKIRLQLDSFMKGLFRNKYFAGTTPSEAYFITVDDTNNTADTIDLGQVNIDVGFAPQKPAEFVIFNLSQKTLTE